jgi:hypothetical protein
MSVMLFLNVTLAVLSLLLGKYGAASWDLFVAVILYFTIRGMEPKEN